MRLSEELVGEVRMAEHTTLVEGVAEGDRASIIPATAHTLDGSVRLALQSEGQRPPLERVAGKVVYPTKKRGKETDQPHIPVRVVEYERDRLLALLDVACSSLVELLEQRREQLI